MSDKPMRFDRFLRRAEKLAQSRGRTQSLLQQVTRKLAAGSTDRFSKLRQQLQLAVALVKDTLSARYRVDTRTLALLLAGLLYFVVPLDVVPDFLFGWGLVDDAAVLSYVFSLLGAELAAYARWREEAAAASDGTAQDDVK